MGLFQTVLVHIWEIDCWKFEIFMKKALAQGIFELEKFPFLIGLEFRQKFIGTSIRVLLRHQRA